jgi:uncharacterized repeat protein (TIGR01451 family)
LSATIAPSDDIRTARVYFRSDKYPDFYYVDMTSEGDSFQAILPMPSDETSRVIYYLEATDVAYASNRSVQYDVDVVEDADECRRRDPGVAYFTGDNPGIVIGALQTGAPAIPPGFLAQGIVSTAAGGGLGAGAAVAIAAGGAGAVAVGVLVPKEEETTTSAVAENPPPPEPPSPPPVTTPPTPPVESVEACFQTFPNPPVITAGDRIRLDGRCSTPLSLLTFEWDLGDGRRKQGAFIEPRFTMAGSYNIELTVRRSSSLTGWAARDPDVDYFSRQITVNPAEVVIEVADLAVTKTGFPNPYPEFWDGYLQYTVTVTNVGTLTATGVTLVDQYDDDMLLETFSLPAGCTDDPFVNTLTCNLNPIPAGSSVVLQYELSPQWEGPPEFIVNNVTVQAENDDNPGNDSVSIAIPVLIEPNSRVLENRTIPGEFTSYLGVRPFDGRVGGRIVVNRAQPVATHNASPVRQRFQGKRGKNTVEAVVTTPMEGEGFWRFDFRGVRGFVAGSLNAEMGQVITMDGQTVVFRLSGVPNEQIRFSFKLDP